MRSSGVTSATRPTFRPVCSTVIASISCGPTRVSLSCLDAATGKVHFEGAKMEGLRTIYSSPVGAGNRIYFTSRGGATKVIQAGETYEELATNQLDDEFDASPAIVGDVIYLRGWKYLYCIAEPDSAD